MSINRIRFETNWIIGKIQLAVFGEKIPLLEINPATSKEEKYRTAETFYETLIDHPGLISDFQSQPDILTTWAIQTRDHELQHALQAETHTIQFQAFQITPNILQRLRGKHRQIRGSTLILDEIDYEEKLRLRHSHPNPSENDLNEIQKLKTKILIRKLLTGGRIFKRNKK